MKSTTIAIIVAVILIGGAIILTGFNGNRDQFGVGNVNSNIGRVNANNVSIVGGKQIIEIRAKGGYLPRASLAKAGLPTIIRFNTSGTFDCSSSVRIPSMNISRSLPPSGVTDIDIGISKTAVLQGTCGMGMYPFSIDFQ